MGNKTTSCISAFSVVDVSFGYNAIVGRPTLNTLRAVSSTYHQKVKFLIVNDIGKALGSKQLAKKCNMATIRNARDHPTLQQVEIDLRDEQACPSPAGDLIEVP